MCTRKTWISRCDSSGRQGQAPFGIIGLFLLISFCSPNIPTNTVAGLRSTTRAGIMKAMSLDMALGLQRWLKSPSLILMRPPEGKGWDCLGPTS